MCGQNSSSSVGRVFVDDTKSPHLIFFGFAIFMLPAIIFNIVAMIIFGKNLSKSSHQASSLLLALACTDTMASVQVVAVHGVRFYRGQTSEVYCGIAAFLESSFPLYSAFIASLMAFDRYLALCKPFFYQSNSSLYHGRLNLILAGVFTVGICCLPYIGLGEYYIYIERNKIQNSTSNCSELFVECNVFQRTTTGPLNVFGCVYGSVGLIAVVAVLMYNGFVLNTVMKMKRAVAAISLTPNEALLRSEVVFAKVIGVLSVVFVLCWTPYMVSVICLSIGLELHPETQKAIHYMTGFNYIADPFVYIFMRKKYRAVIFRLFHNIFRRRKRNRNSTETRAQDVPMSPVAPYF